MVFNSVVDFAQLCSGYIRLSYRPQVEVNCVIILYVVTFGYT